MIRKFRNNEMISDNAVALLAALAQQHRLAAYRALVQAGPNGLSVGELRETLGLAPATLSAHLNTLRHARLVTSTREGRVIRLRADFAQMNALLAYLTEHCCAGAPCDITPSATRRCE